jgi:hypothetical protein
MQEWEQFLQVSAGLKVAIFSPELDMRSKTTTKSIITELRHCSKDKQATNKQTNIGTLIRANAGTVGEGSGVVGFLPGVPVQRSESF